MMNSNPETVSTDYDTSSRLYFEPLTVGGVARWPGWVGGPRRGAAVRGLARCAWAHAA